MAARMSGARRRAQVLTVAASEFANHGLHGASIEAIAREAGITQAYVFRMFATKKALFLELVGAAFDRFSDSMSDAAEGASGVGALARMGTKYYESLAERTTLMLQLQGFAACGDIEVRDLVRTRVARMWHTVAGACELDPVTVKSFLAFGMLLNNVAALDVADVHETWANGVRTRIQPGLFEHITAATNRKPTVGSGERIVSVGYEGRELAEFVRDLVARGVTLVVDVRLNPVSRRRGFSKTALQTALAAADVRYLHLRGLGNPAENRAAFHGRDVEAGRRVYRRLLLGADAQRDLATLQILSDTGTIAIMCVERDEEHCHRKVIIDALRELSVR